jgi:hypothetical protein
MVVAEDGAKVRPVINSPELISLARSGNSWFNANALHHRTAQPFPVAGRAFAALLAALYLFLSLVAIDHALHACWHEDAGQPDHQCVLTLLGNSQVAFVSPTTEPVRSGERSIALCPPIEIHLTSACHRLPPGRGPPTA